MKKTGKRAVLFLAFIMFLGLNFAGSSLKAQDITVEATLSDNIIYAGESVTLNIEVTGREIGTFDRPQLPDIDGLKIIPGRVSQSTSYTFINNRPSTKLSYGFQFTAEKTGRYQIPPITIEIRGETYTTKAVSFQILDPGDVKDADSGPDLFVRLETNTTKPVVGEQVIATIILYFKSEIEVSSYQAMPGWKAEGFWKEELDVERQARSTSTIVNGVRYQRAELLDYAIFPTKPGELVLSPFTVSVRVRQNRSRFMDPFGFMSGQEQKELKTMPLTLTVQSLPKADEALVIGAVGNFKISRSISETQAFVGESVEIETVISGTGNIPLVNKPGYEYPEGLEQYTPRENTQVNRNNRIISGIKTFTDIVIARSEGEFEIPETKIGVFNPGSGKYEYTTLPALTFYAKLDPNAAVSSDIIENRLNIKPQTGLARWEPASAKVLLYDSSLFVWLALPFILLAAAFGAKQYRDRMAGDTGFYRAQKAREQALLRLDEAGKTNDIKHGYHLIQSALIQFIADKCTLPEAGLSAGQVVNEITKRAPGADLSTLKKLFDKCESIAFAPNVTQEGLKDDIELAKKQLNFLGKHL